MLSNLVAEKIAVRSVVPVLSADRRLAPSDGWPTGVAVQVLGAVVDGRAVPGGV